MTKGTLKTCANGHQFRKSSDCPTCPKCEAEKEPASTLLSGLGAPARRALEREGIMSAFDLAQYTEAQVLALHGVGPSSLPRLQKALEAEGMAFKDKT